MASQDSFSYFVDRFADIQVLRYRIPGFEDLPLKTKTLLYYLYEAALAGRDITWDQNYRYNLAIRRTLEQLVRHYSGDRSCESWQNLMAYTKRVWFSNGIHHHYSNSKFAPEFTRKQFAQWLQSCPDAEFPLGGRTLEAFIQWLTPILFEGDVASKKVCKDSDKDLLEHSCVNYYRGLTQDEAQAYYKAMKNEDDATPPSYGLNSRLEKVDGEIREVIWKVGGLYTEAIERIVYWLELAAGVAENEQQAEAFNHLINYYKTGDLATFDAYNIAWLKDTQSQVDTINGFIESYNDPLDYRGTFEAIVSVKDEEATHRIDTIARNAQWFENHSPIANAHKKTEVTGISGAVINVVVGSGDANPCSPIGVNLPNADWVREAHGSKSVNLANIVASYSQVKGKITEEFMANEEEIARAHEHGELADNLHTDLHEVIGHGSGRLMPGVGTPKETLQNYSSTLEESRADLVALYYLMDPQLIELGLMPSLDVGKACYENFMVNGLMMQLRRLAIGEQLEEDHMRNRQLIAQWAMVNGPDVVRMVKRNGKTYVEITDYEALRSLFGQLLHEVQRIKSEGDYEAGKALVEKYGVAVDKDLHEEVLERFAALNMAPYFGFLNPVMEAVRDADGNISDVTVNYEGDFVERMFHYADHHSFLPTDNG